MISAETAVSTILNAIRPTEAMTVSLAHSSGHVLAEAVVASENIPPFDNSGMDGFAVRHEDTMQVPAVLHVTDEIPAGAVSRKKLHTGEAIAIMTGAKIPDGCTAVIQQEWTERIDQTSVRVLRSVQEGHNVRRAGADIRAGATVFKQGHHIQAQELGVLASLGQAFISVHRAPTVAILATGNELVEFGKPVAEGKIRNSNFSMLKGLVEQLGCTTIDLGIGRDTKEELRMKLTAGLGYDVLITSGGVSVGKYDFVLETLEELGVERHFWKVNIKPGMPLFFGMHSNTVVFGLPGNPVSSFVTFVQFVKPALLRMKGHAHTTSVRLPATLQEPISKTDGKRHFVRGFVEYQAGELYVRTTGAQTSNILTSLTSANCFIIIPESAEKLQAGDRVEVELL